MRHNRFTFWWAIAACLLGFTRPARAHDPGLSAVNLVLEGERLSAQLSFARSDLQSIAGSSGLESLMRRSIEVSLDHQQVPPQDVSVWSDDSNTIYSRMSFPGVEHARLRVRSVLILSLARGHRQYLSLRDRRGTILREQMLDGAANVFEVPLAFAVSGSQGSSFVQFLGLGVRHILSGYDHLLFLFGLLLVGVNFRSVAKIITAFTVAHSITLAAATLNLVEFPSRIVEPLIAVSIIYVGLENILSGKLDWRWLLTFGFGLVHGFGFASVLRELSIGTGAAAVVPLLSFNLGVELGQMTIAALTLPLIWKLRKQPVFVARYVPACSLLVALAGSYWLIQRTLLL